MRINLATSLASRDGTLTKDAQIKNAFIEGDQNESAIFRRPGISTASVTVSGNGQGGIADTLIFIVNGDTMKSYNSTFTLQATYTLWEYQ